MVSGSVCDRILDDGILVDGGGERAGATGIPPPVRDTPKTNLPIGSGVDQVIVIDSPTPPHDALT